MNKSHIKVWRIQSVMLSSTLLIMALKAGNAELMGVSGPSLWHSDDWFDVIHLPG